MHTFFNRESQGLPDFKGESPQDSQKKFLSQGLKLCFLSLKTGKPSDFVKRGGNKLQMGIRQEELSLMKAPILYDYKVIMFEL